MHMAASQNSRSGSTPKDPRSRPRIQTDPDRCHPVTMPILRRCPQVIALSTSEPLTPGATKNQKWVFGRLWFMESNKRTNKQTNKQTSHQTNKQQKRICVWKQQQQRQQQQQQQQHPWPVNLSKNIRIHQVHGALSQLITKIYHQKKTVNVETFVEPTNYRSFIEICVHRFYRIQPPWSW